MSKICKLCKIGKDPVKDFYIRNVEKGTRRAVCKKCLNSNQYNYLRRNCKNRRNWCLKHFYGVDLNWYNETFEEQEGRCAACYKHQSELEKALAVDHCHQSKKVRGLLCSNCNSALGMSHDSIKTLLNLVKYLEKHSKSDQKGI